MSASTSSTYAGSVLIIEDNDGLAEGLRSALEEAGYVAVVASNGEVALRYLGCMTPDLILYDLVMPQLDGAALVEALRREPRLSEVPRLGMTGLNGAGRLAQNERVLHKPFELAELLRAVRSVRRPSRGTEEARAD